MSIDVIKPSNFILLVDSYKLHHYAEYPVGTERIYSTVVPRKPSMFTDQIVAMGAAYVAAYLAGVRITQEMIDEAEVEVNQMGYEFNRGDWEIIANHLGGKLPLMVMGVEEGTVVKPGTPILGIINTDTRFAWLVSYVETVVQRIMWKATTVASQSRFIYKEIEAAMQESGADMNMLGYKLHNFGDRGADGEDAAMIAAIAHGALFSGSDCTSANRYIKSIYKTEHPYFSSVDATEHSVMCANSDAEAKDDFGAAVMAVERLEETVARAKRGIGIPLQSVVIDTYDDERFVREYLGKRLKDRIQQSGGVLVARPDSGDPLTRPVQIIQWLDEAFGSTVNNKGFKVLNPCVRVIQGDGINEGSIPLILNNLLIAGYSADNLTFGMGGGLTHGGSRDQFSFSMKATAMFRDGKWVPLLKSPKTDAGKKSLKGLVKTVQNADGQIEVITCDRTLDIMNSHIGWRCYYIDGHILYTPDYDSVRIRARS